MSKNIYQTDHFTDAQIKRMKASANRQEKAIARIYFNNPEKQYGPWQILQILVNRGKTWPITSVRRAIDTLQNDNILQKTGNVREGKYGRNEGLLQWKKLNGTGRSEQANMFDEPQPKPKSGILGEN